MPNPNPVQSESFKEKRFEPAKDIPKDVVLAKNPRCVKLPQGIDAVIAEIPKKERSAWIRQAICKEAIAQGLANEIA